MTQNEALKTIAILKKRNDLSCDEMRKGFQIALALCDDSLVEFFRESYHQHFSAFILDLALHIDDPEKIELFQQNQHEWERISYCDAELILIAIMVKAKQRSLQADILVRQLKDKYIYKSYFYENKFLAFVEKSIDELIDSYLADFKDRALSSSFNDLYSKALKSCDKILLEVALEKAEALNEKYMAASLLGCIASSKSNDNIVEALEITSSITFQDLKESALYDIAKKIYAQDLQKAVAIISALPTRAQYGFRAFLSSSNKDLNDIISSIKEIDTLHKTHFMSDNDYSDCLLKIAYSIIGNYPHLTCNLLEKLNNFWGEEIYIEIEIQIEIAIAFSKNDLEEGISYLLNFRT